MRKLILVGGGHAHLFVLKKLATIRFTDVDITLITPSVWQDYSGMLPGWMAGNYDLNECRIDLRNLAIASHCRIIEDSIVGMDADNRCVCLSSGQHVHYDFLSLDIGSETDLEWLLLLERKLVPIKPFDKFRDAWLEIVIESKKRADYRLAIVGGGAAGVELAFAAHQQLNREATGNSVMLITGMRGLLPDHNANVRARVTRHIAQQGIQLLTQRAVATQTSLVLSDGTEIKPDKVIAATGAKPAVWLTLSKLALDNAGFILVNSSHQSLSHTNVFAAGNVCSRPDTRLQRSGVHAVKAGPILAYNIIAALRGAALKMYTPRKNSLYLLRTHEQYAIASWGDFSAEGKWVWKWKDGLDKHFINKFTPC